MDAGTAIGITARDLSRLSSRDFKQYVAEFLKPKLKEKVNKISLVYPYALNCKIEEKIEDQHKVYRYTVFLNNMGTIAHVLDAENPDAIIRVTFKPSLKFLSKKRQLMIIYHKVKNIINVEEPKF